MARPFDAFVIFAEMRTGSNHLEAMLAAVPGLRPLGEVFNPVFIGKQNQTELLGIDLAGREADPGGLLDAVLSLTDGLPGLRFFHDHDPRVLNRILEDRRIAKVILTRNPLDSYISRRIATETGQWKMTDVRNRKAAQIRFDPAEFDRMLANWAGFQTRVRRVLQTTGQTAFSLDYSDLSDRAVLTGLLRFLGVTGKIGPGASELKPQNPEPAAAKVTNPDEMEAALARIDPFAMHREAASWAPEPAAIKSLMLAPRSPLMVMPLPGCLDIELAAWLAALDGDAPETIRRGLAKRDIRRWMRANPTHRRVSVLRHPLARAHHVFCSELLPPARPGMAELRRILRNRYDIPVPKEGAGPDYGIADHRAAFLAFLTFLKPCLAGQTVLDPPPVFTGQLSALRGLARFAPPDRVFRETELPDLLPDLAQDLGLGAMPELRAAPDAPYSLGQIYDAELEAAARAAYRRDYVFFGFGDWR